MNYRPTSKSNTVRYLFDHLSLHVHRLREKQLHSGKYLTFEKSCSSNWRKAAARISPSKAQEKQKY